MKVRKSEAKNGGALIEIETDAVWTALSSRFDPGKEAQRVLEKQEFDADIFFLLGAGNLELVKLLSQKAESAPLVIFENLPQITKWAEEITGEDDGPRYFLNKDYQNTLAELLRRHPSKRLKLFFNRVQTGIDAGWYEEVRRAVIDAHDRKSINQNTLGRFEKLWLRNICRNTYLSATAPGINTLTDAGKGAVAVLICAGPSLAIELPRLKANRHKLVVIAVDTVYRTLLSHGITADFVVIVDPQKVNSKYVENLGSEAANTFAVAEPAVCPAALKAFSGRTAVFNTIFPWFHFVAARFGSKGDIDMGGSVATTAFELARVMQFKAAAFLGLDLCFSRDSYHLPGTMYEEDWYSDVTRLKPWDTMTYKLMDFESLESISNIRGESVKTDSRFNMFRHWFEKKFAAASYPIVNASQGAAEIKGMRWQSFEDFLNENTPQEDGRLEVIRKAKEVYSHVYTPADGAASLWKSDVKTVLKNIAEFQKTAARAEAAAVKALRRVSMGQTAESESRTMGELDAVLSQDFPGKAFVNIVLQSMIAKLTGTRSASNKPEEIFQTSLDLYRAMREAAELNLRCIHPAQDVFD